MDLLVHTASTGLSTVLDVLPIAVILFAFQLLVIRRRPPNLKRVLFGFAYVLVGLTFFLVGLEPALPGESGCPDVIAAQVKGMSLSRQHAFDGVYAGAENIPLKLAHTWAPVCPRRRNLPGTLA